MAKKTNPTNKGKIPKSIVQSKKTKTETEPKKERSYFETRIYDELGLTDAQNTIKLKIEDLEAGTNPTVTHKIFAEDAEGNIEITPYTIDRELFQYDHPNADPTKANINNSRRKVFKIVRLKTPEVFTDKKGNEKVRKYNLPKGAGTLPFIPPGLLKKFEKKEKIITLSLTEGYFKAMAGDINGLDIVGLSSIQHYKEKETQMMYSGVLRIIKVCKVKNVIILYDGDARNISNKDLAAGRDLRRRPHGFISSALKVRELLKDSNVDIYYAEINSRKLNKGNPKGLDDLYQAYRDEAKEITKDLTSLSRPASFFQRENITFNTARLYQFFEMGTVENFYKFHSDAIKEREFMYSGTTYIFNQKTGFCDIKVPGLAKDYFRVATDYYKWGIKPNKYGQKERVFTKWTKAAILDDHKKQKNFVDFVPRYFTFTNVPDHVNFQQVVHNCFNVYAPFEHEEDEGDCSVTLEFIKHIFQEHYELGLDYVQILYQRPTQILPILCLVSKENKTGKSTFLKWLKAIFKQNCTIIGNDALNSEFNASWSTKLIVGCEETLLDKKPAIEKLKALSTADSINMNRKGKDHEDIEFFAKFILCSNNENNFIYATKSDIRYWVRKVPVFEGKERVNLLQEMMDEIPAFLHFLNRRKMSTDNETRMWFKEELLKTEALEKLIKNSRTGIEKELYEWLKNTFLEFGEDSVLLAPKDIAEFALKRKIESSYISKIITDNLHAELPGAKTKFYKIPEWIETINLNGEPTVIRKDHVRRGRPFLFEVKKILDKYDYKIWKSVHREPEPEPEPPLPKKPLEHQKTIMEGISEAEKEKIEQDLPF